MRNKFASWDRRYFLRTMATGLFGAAGSTAFGAAQGNASASSQHGEGPKITGIKTYKFNVATGQAIRDPSNRQAVSSPFKTWLFLKVETDQGIDGWGEGSIEWLSPVIEATLEAAASGPFCFGCRHHLQRHHEPLTVERRTRHRHRHRGRQHGAV